MRIAFFVNVFPPRHESFIVNQVKGLLDGGHEVDIFAGARGPSQALAQDTEHEALPLRTFFRPEMPESRWPRYWKGASLGLRYGTAHPKALFGAFRHWQRHRAFGPLRLFFESIPFLQSQQFDLLHCQYGSLGAMAVALRDLGILSGPIATSFRGEDLTRGIRTFPHVYRRLFEVGDLFLPVSDYFRGLLLEYGCRPERVQVMRSAVDCGRFPFRVRGRQAGERPIKLVTVARLVEKKVVEYAIRAVGQVAAAGHRLEYEIIGDGPLRGELEGLAGTVCPTGTVRFLGWLPAPEVAAHLDRADIAINASVTAANGNSEGIPNTLKEAMACGMPVLATEHSGIPELVKHGISGYLVPERDSAALAEALQRLLAEPGRWEAMGRAGRAHVMEHYDLGRLTAELIHCYERLVPPSGRPDSAGESSRAKLPSALSS